MRSLRTKIMIIVMACIALLGTAFVLYSLFTTSNYKRMRLENIEKTLAFETEKVNKTIAEIERGAVWFAQGAYLCYETQSQDLGKKLVVDYLHSFSIPIGGGFWYAPYAYNKQALRAGSYAFFDTALGEVRLDDTFFMDEYDYHSMNWYREIVALVHRPYEVAWTKPYVADTGSHSLMTTAGAGIFNADGTLIAMSTVDWEISELINELMAIKPTNGSYILLSAPEKDYIISSTHSLDNVGASLQSLPWDIHARSFTLNGIRYQTFDRKMDNGWLLSAQVPENEIFEEIEEQNNRFTLISVALSLLMLCVAYYLLSRQINRPLKLLTDDVAQHELGNLDVFIELNSDDELGLLAKTFNLMTARLKEAIEANTSEHATRERIATELHVATTIQASILPCIFPPYPDRSEFDIYASMFPAKEVGGDFYDFFLLGDSHLVVVIADVAGKGVPAALFMVIAKTLIKNTAQYGKSPKEVFETANEMLCENNEAAMFVTAFMGVLEISTGCFSYVNAGHNPPLIKRANGQYEHFPVKAGFVLAGMEGTIYQQEETLLEPGDTLFLYTDGIPEAVNRRNEQFSEQRLLAAANRYKDCGLKEFLAYIKMEIDTFEDGVNQADDITMLVLKMIGGVK